MKKRTKNLLCVFLIVLGLGLLGTAGWLWYDNNVDRSGWIEENGIYSYADFHGKKITGWLTLEDKIYHFDDQYQMSTAGNRQMLFWNRRGASSGLYPD